MSEYIAHTQQSSVYLPPELGYRLEAFARLEGVSTSDLILRAIEQHLEELEDVTDAEKVLSGIEHGEIHVISLQEMERRLAVDN